MSRLSRFLRRSGADRWLLLEALALLCWARLLVRVVSFRRIAPHLGQPMTESPREIGDTERQLAWRIAWAVQAVARNAPMGFVCLQQAIAAKWMLRRRRVPSTLYLGLQRKDELDLTAHAWLRVGDRILTGRAESLNHTVIATFS
jgi:Transglutaminase-like superfamily